MVRGKKEFLVRWKGYMVEEDTQENRENLENARKLVEEFEREYGQEAKTTGTGRRREGVQS